jgi:tRNA pseudouridine38-40 synthase
LREIVKVALLVAYDGTDLHGFARQPRQRTVQGELERCLADLFRKEVSTVGAGRTDAGVHASGQVVSFEGPDGAEPEWVRDRLNRRLSPEISVRAAARVPDAFDARRSARWREYAYRFYLDSTPDPFEDRYALHVTGRFEAGALRRAARALVGEHDFSSFCRRGEGSLTRRVRRVSLAYPAARRPVLRIVADSFCHQMVRSIVGTLLQVAERRRRPEDLQRILAARDRRAAGPVALARGLHLVAVGYARDPFRGVPLKILPGTGGAYGGCA